MRFTFRLRSLSKTAARSFLGPPAFFRPALLFLAGAVGVAVAVMGNLEIHPRSGWGVSGLLQLDLVPQAEFGIDWGRRLQGTVPVQEQAGDRFFLLLCGLCLAAVAVLATNLSILLAGRWRAGSHGRAIRIACGASGPRIRLEEALGGAILAALGAAMGLGLGYLGKFGLALTWPHALAGSPLDLELVAWVPVVGLCLLMVPGTGMVRQVPSGTRGDLTRLLGGGNRLMGSRYPEGLKGLLPAIQVGLSITLLMGSVVVLRGVWAEQGKLETSGAREEALWVPVVASPSDGGGRPGAEAWNGLLSEMREIPGVDGVALFTPGAWLGLGPARLTWTHCGACRVGGMWVPFQAPPVRYHVVTPDSFRAMGIAVTRGREFGPGDGPGAPLVAVVNASYAQEHFDAEGPLGRTIRLGLGPNAWHTVVGVVENFGIGAVGSTETPSAAVFVSAYQHPPDRADLFLTSNPGRAPPGGAAVGVVEGRGQIVLAGEPKPFSDVITRAESPFGWFAGVALGLGLLTLCAAVFGVYSLANYSVRLRVGEIGLRRALGASPLRISLLVLWRSGKILVLGTFLGLEGALLLCAAMGEVSSQGQGFDPLLFLAAVSAMALAAVLGTVAPARSAAGVPPGVAMSGATGGIWPRRAKHGKRRPRPPTQSEA
jgi:hypothetical protein